MFDSQNILEIVKDSILIDTNMIIPLIDKGTPLHAEAEAQIKMAALTCQHFIVIDSVESELQVFKGLGKKVDQLLSRKIFKKINMKDIYRFYDRKGLQDFGYFYQSSSSKPMRAPRPGKLPTDIELLLASNKLSIPILTRDLDIIHVSHKSSTSKLSFELPFPFDSNATKEIDLDELIGLTEPLRRIYSKAFEQIKSDFAHIESLKGKNVQKDELLKKHRQLANDMNQELQDLHISGDLWRRIAKPNIGETIIWTVIEVALGFIPVPIPTSPFNHIIQFSRYKGVERKIQN